MRRVHLQLTDEQAAAVESNAAATGRPLTSVLREAVELWRTSQERTRRIERALAVTGGFRSGRNDVSEHHDDYLAMDLEAEMQERWR